MASEAVTATPTSTPGGPLQEVVLDKNGNVSQVLAYETSAAFKALSGERPAPSDHRVLTTMRALLGVSALMDVASLVDEIYRAEQAARILIRSKEVVWSVITERTFEPRIDALIAVLDSLNGDVIDSVRRGLVALKKMTFAVTQEDHQRDRYDFQLVLRKDDTYTFFVFNYQCKQEMFDFQLPVLGVNNFKTNYAHCLITFTAEERELNL